MVSSIPLQFLALLGFGFVLGLKHALDADHLAAISTLIARTKNIRISSFLGALWGIGHTTTLLVVGIAVLLLKVSIPQKMAISFELLVGMMLVALGADVLRKLMKKNIHVHAHDHGGVEHIYVHAHADSPAHNHMHRSFFIGTVHGLAGSAGLLLLVLASVSSLRQGILFILIFGLGTILGMCAITTVIGSLVVYLPKYRAVGRGVELCAGAGSIMLGVFIVYKFGSMLL